MTNRSPVVAHRNEDGIILDADRIEQAFACLPVPDRSAPRTPSRARAGPESRPHEPAGTPRAGRQGNAAAATEAVTKIVEQQPELRERAVQILSEELAHAEANDPADNGSLLSALLTLKAVEALPVIRQAFEKDAVDEMVAGDWSAVLVGLGQTPDPADPLVARSQARWNVAQAALFPPFLAELALPRAAPRPAAKKSSRSTQKTKRKMASASRKANRKKKRK